MLTLFWSERVTLAVSIEGAITNQGTVVPSMPAIG